jgi:hypothetical protein
MKLANFVGKVLKFFRVMKIAQPKFETFLVDTVKRKEALV